MSKQKLTTTGDGQTIPVKGAIPNTGVVPGVRDLGGDTLDAGVDVSGGFGTIGFHAENANVLSPGSRPGEKQGPDTWLTDVGTENRGAAGSPATSDADADH